MPALHRLTDRKVKSNLKPGRYADGGCLFLRVKESGARSFAFMSDLTFQSGRRRVQYGLGGFPTVSLSEARVKAAELRRKVRNPVFRARLEQGASIKSLIEEESRCEASRMIEAVPTFGAFAKQWMNENLDAMTSNPKARQQWYNSLATYAAPINDKQVNIITVSDVLACLSPIWQTKHETARRVQQRIFKILAAAKVHGYRDGDNPAQWQGNLELTLPKPKRARKHQVAMPYGDIPSFWKRLQAKTTIASLALQFVILTAARSGEGRGARWDEIDLEAKVWTLPPERMKARKEHSVPLCDCLVTMLTQLKDLAETPFVFPSSAKTGFVTETAVRSLLKEMQAECTTHGFRSTFRDWAGNETEFPRELMEEALAHQLGSVEAAYRRSKAIERRRNLMEAWSGYLSAEMQNAMMAAQSQNRT